jgi:putative transposase
MRFRFIYHHRQEYRIVKMAKVLKVTVAGYYLWLKRLNSRDEKPDKQKLSDIVRKEYLESNCVYGSRKISKVINIKILNYQKLNAVRN